MASYVASIYNSLGLFHQNTDRHSCGIEIGYKHTNEQQLVHGVNNDLCDLHNIKQKFLKF